MSVSRYLPRVRLLLLWGLELLLCCCHGLAAEASPSSGGGVIYPPLTEDIDGMAETPLFVGLIESYDPAHPDQLLRSVGTIVGTEMALDHINANPSILPGYRLYYNFINSQVCYHTAANMEKVNFYEVNSAWMLHAILFLKYHMSISTVQSPAGSRCNTETGFEQAH